MAEGTYEYECMRAELLGIEKPDFDEFTKNQQEEEQKKVEEEEADVDIIKEVDVEKDGLTIVSGGLDELNSILKKTQTKIHRLKDSCGSITSIIKDKVSSKWGSQSSIDKDNVEGTTTTKPEEKLHGESSQIPQSENGSLNNPNEVEKSSRKSDLSKALNTDLSKLDTMIEKAEQAQYSMEHQRKEMKKFLK